MIRLGSTKHETTAEGLRIYLEADTQLALTSPEAQRLAFNYAKSAGYNDYGLNKFVPTETNSVDEYAHRGYWLFLPSQWNRNSIKL